MQRFRIEKYLQHNIEVFGFWTVPEVTKNQGRFPLCPQVLAPNFTVHGTVMQL